MPRVQAAKLTGATNQPSIALTWLAGEGCAAASATFAHLDLCAPVLTGLPSPLATHTRRWPARSPRRRRGLHRFPVAHTPRRPRARDGGQRHHFGGVRRPAGRHRQVLGLRRLPPARRALRPRRGQRPVHQLLRCELRRRANDALSAKMKVGQHQQSRLPCCLQAGAIFPLLHPPG